MNLADTISSLDLRQCSKVLDEQTMKESASELSEIQIQRLAVIRLGRLFLDHSQNERVAFSYFQAYRAADAKLKQMELKQIEGGKE